MPNTPISRTCLAIQLIHLDAVGRHAHHGRDRGRERGAVDNLAPVEHELQRLAQPGKVERCVFHFEGDAVELGACHRNRAFDIYWRERDEGGLTLFQGFDYAVKAGYVWHKTVLLRYSLVKILYQRVPGLTTE